MSQPIVFKGSRLATWLLSLLGWRVEFEGLPGLQGVVVVYPHTSNWDFIVGILAKWSIGIPVHFWGKESLFQYPLVSRWLRWVGGLPIRRSSPQGAVAAMAQTFEQYRANDRLLWLALAPEGTRSYRPGWRSGFYQLTLQAGVPLGVASLDWGRRRVRFVDFLTLTGDPVQDYQALSRLYEGVQGFAPAKAAPIVPMSAPTRSD